MPNKLTMAEARKIALLALEEADKRRAETRDRERRIADVEEALDVPAGWAAEVVDRIRAYSWVRATPSATTTESGPIVGLRHTLSRDDAIRLIQQRPNDTDQQRRGGGSA